MQQSTFLREIITLGEKYNLGEDACVKIVEDAITSVWNDQKKLNNILFKVKIKENLLSCFRLMKVVDTVEDALFEIDTIAAAEYVNVKDIDVPQDYILIPVNLFRYLGSNRLQFLFTKEIRKQCANLKRNNELEVFKGKEGVIVRGILKKIQNDYVIECDGYLLMIEGNISNRKFRGLLEKDYAMVGSELACIIRYIDETLASYQVVVTRRGSEFLVGACSSEDNIPEISTGKIIIKQHYRISGYGSYVVVDVSDDFRSDIPSPAECCIGPMGYRARKINQMMGDTFLRFVNYKSSREQLILNILKSLPSQRSQQYSGHTRIIDREDIIFIITDPLFVPVIIGPGGINVSLISKVLGEIRINVYSSELEIYIYDFINMFQLSRDEALSLVNAGYLTANNILGETMEEFVNKGILPKEQLESLWNRIQKEADDYINNISNEYYSGGGQSDLITHIKNNYPVGIILVKHNIYTLDEFKKYDKVQMFNILQEEGISGEDIKEIITM